MSRVLPMPMWDVDDSRARVLIEATDFAKKSALVVVPQPASSASVLEAVESVLG